MKEYEQLEFEFVMEIVHRYNDMKKKEMETAHKCSDSQPYVIVDNETIIFPPYPFGQLERHWQKSQPLINKI